MSELPSYAILGRGRWATIMEAILAAESRRVVLIEDTRRRNSESEANYISRLGELLDRSGARIAWLCVPPGPHVPAMLKASIAAGLNAVIEKPWLCSEAETESLLALAGERRLLLAVHYQYCLLDQVEGWRRDFNQGAGLCFSGRFTLGAGTGSEYPRYTTWDLTYWQSGLTPCRSQVFRKSNAATTNQINAKSGSKQRTNEFRRLPSFQPENLSFSALSAGWRLRLTRSISHSIYASPGVWRTI